MPYTLVAFHAHPDDEAVLTAGTMARAAAEGHRIVVVYATDGGLTTTGGAYTEDDELGAYRLLEARASARILGVSRFEYLGYADSGPVPAARRGRRTSFVAAPVADAAGLLAAILVAESADIVLGYDRNGGYGHPDHVRVHQVAAEAARLAATTKLLEATAPRGVACRAMNLRARLQRYDSEGAGPAYHRMFSARAEITHRVSVHRYVGAKRACLQAHHSQTSARTGMDRTLAALRKVPRPFYDIAVGHEWFIDRAHHGPAAHDIFSGLS